MSETQLDRMEWKIDRIWAAIMSSDLNNTTSEKDLMSAFPRLTTKQHAVLQMLLNGKSNKLIADRFGVTENTAKVYVRGIAAKFNVNTRAQIVLEAVDMFQRCSDSTYFGLSGGLPKDWDTNYKKPDKYRHLLVKKR